MILRFLSKNQARLNVKDEVVAFPGRKNRTKRFAYLDGLWPIGYFTGMFFAGMIKEDLGYMYNYALGILTR